MTAGLGQATLVKDKDTVGPDYAGQPVGDDESGAALHEPVQGLLYDRLVFCINAGKGLVQNQYGRVLEQGPGYGYSLALAARQSDGPLADEGVVALRQLGDELVGVGGPGRGLQLLLSGVGLAEPQVVRHRPVKEVGVLGDNGDLVTKLVKGELPQIEASQCYPPLLRVEESVHQPHDSGLTCAAGPHQPQLFALLEGE